MKFSIVIAGSEGYASPRRGKIEELDAFSRSRNSTIRSKHVVIEKTRKRSVSYDNVEFIRTPFLRS